MDFREKSSAIFWEGRRNDTDFGTKIFSELESTKPLALSTCELSWRVQNRERWNTGGDAVTLPRITIWQIDGRRVCRNVRASHFRVSLDDFIGAPM